MTVKPRGVDIFHLESLLSDEELQIRDTVRSFVTNEVSPVITEHWRLGKFPLELARKLGSLGVLGAQAELPDFPAVSPLAAGLVYQELERGDAGLRSFASVQNCLVINAIRKYGSDAQRRRWLGPLARAEAIGAFALTEPDHGSDPNNMSTRANRSGDYYVLHGSKAWITNGSIADLVIVWARAEDDVRAFIVERDSEGFSSFEISGKHGMRMSVTSELSFDECPVPGDNVLPGAVGLKSCLKLLNDARYAIAWGAVGSASACFEEVMAYTGSRVQFGRPLSSFQLVQEKLADMACLLTESQLLCYHLARLAEADELMHHHISMAKRHNVRAALQIARTARDLLGANGMCDEYPVFRHLANLEAQSTIDGTDHIHALIIGHSLTGYAAYCR